MRDPAGNAELERLAGGADRTRTIRRGAAANAVALECARQDDETVTVRLFANDDELAAAGDPSPLGPFKGAGIFAVSLSGVTDVRFDDFVVRRSPAGPSPAAERSPRPLPERGEQGLLALEGEEEEVDHAEGGVVGP